MRISTSCFTYYYYIFCFLYCNTVLLKDNSFVIVCIHESSDIMALHFCVLSNSERVKFISLQMLCVGA